MLYQINPIEDPRWADLLRRHQNASVFHTPGWLEALRRTYGYEVVAITSSPPRRDLENGLVFCGINSWLSGRRLVSLPFSDHCECLVEDAEHLREMLDWFVREYRHNRWKYVEIRPKLTTAENGDNWGMHRQFCLHVLDLCGSPEVLFGRFHKSSTQAKIRRAGRDDLVYEEGRSEALLRQFYGLLQQTRRRHGVPPQPFDWFRNLTDCMANAVKVRVASKEGRPIAGILTLSYKNTILYKYGCSDPRFHNLGGIQLLFWKSIQEAKSNGCVEMDFGRSDLDNAGLITFKDRWGAARIPLSYWRLPAHTLNPASRGWTLSVAKQLLARAPDFVLAAVGRLIYKHLG